MHCAQLRTTRKAVHTVGITEHGVLYIDVQRFYRGRSRDARTFYVLPVDVARIKRSTTRASMSDRDLVRLFAASFNSAEHALDWLRWARVPVIRRRDPECCCNAESVAGRRLVNPANAP